MARLTPEFIQQIKQAISLVDVARENIELKKSGNRFMGRCPFHGDRTPSFSVNKDFYYCFGCKEAGDVIAFVTKLHGLSFEEACEDLAERANLKMPENLDPKSSAEERAQAERRKQIQQSVRLNYFAAFKYYHQNLLQGRSSPLFQEARDYLKQRGISSQTIDQFQVGVASQQSDGLTQFLMQAKAPLEAARQVGLIRPSTKPTPGKAAGDFDLFRERVMFPLIDIRGRVCGFGGRLLPSVGARQDRDGHEMKLPKYINSSESDLFQKSKFLYGFYQAKVAIRESETVMVVEGYFDVVALHQHGFQNVVATCGTSLTDDHFKTLARLAKRIIVFFDQDQAGQDATVKAMELGLRQGVLTYGIPYESALDPDEFLLQSPDHQSKLQGWMEQAIPTLDQWIERKMKSTEGQIEARSQALKEILGWLGSYSDPVGRSLRLQQLEQKWRVPAEALRQLKSAGPSAPLRPTAALQASSPQASSPQASSPRPTNAPRPAPRPVTTGLARRKPISKSDRQLLQYLVRFSDFGAIFSEFQKDLPVKDSWSVWFDDTEIAAWLAPWKQEPSGWAQLRTSPEAALGPTISQELRSVIMEGLLSEVTPKDVEDLRQLLKQGTRRAWARFSQQQARDLKAQMADADARQDTERFKELSQQFLDLQRKLKELDESYVE
jgi:DNA primase